jgi:hypothetical protein
MELQLIIMKIRTDTFICTDFLLKMKTSTTNLKSDSAFPKIPGITELYSYQDMTIQNTNLVFLLLLHVS